MTAQCNSLLAERRKISAESAEEIKILKEERIQYQNQIGQLASELQRIQSEKVLEHKQEVENLSKTLATTEKHLEEIKKERNQYAQNVEHLSAQVQALESQLQQKREELLKIGTQVNMVHG